MKKAGTFEKEVAEMGDGCIGVRARFLNRVITAIYDDTFRPLGITTNQMSILVSMVLKGLTSPKEIGHFLQMEKSTLSRNLVRMKRQGLILILDGEDGRTQHLELTAKGKRAIERGIPLWEEAQRKAGAILGKDRADAFRKMVDVVWQKVTE